MLKSMFILVLMILSTSIGIGQSNVPNLGNISNEFIPNGSNGIKLFNGVNLEGWYTYIKSRGRNSDPKDVFSVNNGMIRISGEEWGCISTESEYQNYRLVVEFRWGERTHQPRLNNARDSGILLHSQGEDGSFQGIWMNSIECQLIEGGTGDFIVVGDNSEDYEITSLVNSTERDGAWTFDLNGKPKTIRNGRINWYGRDLQWKDTIGFRGKRDVELPLGDWNRIECIALNNEITIILNGVIVNKATKVKPDNGRIQIQSEGAEIFFRKIELLPL